MRARLEHLKRQHPAVRTRYAILGAGSITGVIALIWLTTLPVRFGNTFSSQNNDSAKTTASAISAFGETVAPNVNQLQQSIGGSGSTATPPDTSTGVQGLQIAPTPDDGSAPLGQNAEDSSTMYTNTGASQNSSYTGY